MNSRQIFLLHFTALLVAACFIRSAGADPSPAPVKNTASVVVQSSNQPHIDGIDIVGQFVAIHFNSDAFRTYYLQRRDDLSAAWVTIRTFRQLPFAYHLVASDDYTGKMRYYRLAATP